MNVIESLIEASDSAYRRWLLANRRDAVLPDDCTMLFGFESVQERNETYEVQAWLPRFLMIAQEGDRAYVMEAAEKAPIFATDLGSLNRDNFKEVAASFAAWENEAFVLPEKEPSHLPLEADIYVSGLARDDVASVSRLKKFLNASWPVSKYRDLLANQPFLAKAAGHPIAIERRLTRQQSDLSQYLYYRSPDGLKPILRWS